MPIESSNENEESVAKFCNHGLPSTVGWGEKDATVGGKSGRGTPDGGRRDAGVDAETLADHDRDDGEV